MAKDPVFENNPTISCYYKTSDGEAFYKDFDANSHARTLDNKEVQTITKDSEPVKEKPAKAEDFILAIKETTTLEGLEQFKNDTRSTVLKAIETRTAELTANTN
jgi:hypothetical protein